MRKKFIFLILAYFKFFAKLQLLKNSPLIIGITGSSGKTSLRDSIYAILKEKRNVKVSYKSNSETGIPLNILGLSPKNFSIFDWLRLMIISPIKLLTNWEKYDTYLVEMGIDSPLPPKNMEYLLTILKPDIGIILNTSLTHSQPFDFLVQTNDKTKRKQQIIELITKEKGKIVTKLKNKDTAIINIDQKEIRNLKKDIKAKTITFGTDDNSDVKLLDYSINLKGTTFGFKYKNELATINLKNQLLAKHFGLTFAAAISVGITLKITFKDTCELIEKNFKSPVGRSNLIQGINNSLIIDSSYNASKKTMLEMMGMVQLLPAKRKICLLGDMRELGEIAQVEHELVAKKAVEISDLIILVGPLMKKFALPIIKRGNIEVHWFKNAYLAANYLKNKLKKEDLILVKASQNYLLLEIAVKILMKNPSDATKLLARRGEYWDKKRKDLI